MLGDFFLMHVDVCGWRWLLCVCVCVLCMCWHSSVQLKLTTVTFRDLVPLCPGSGNPKEFVPCLRKCLVRWVCSLLRCLLAEADPDNPPGSALRKPLQRVPAPKAGSPALCRLDTKMKQTGRKVIYEHAILLLSLELKTHIHIHSHVQSVLPDTYKNRGIPYTPLTFSLIYLVFCAVKSSSWSQTARCGWFWFPAFAHVCRNKEVCCCVAMAAEIYHLK